ncbi:hypothetical protein VTN00DRAFT_8900 [Thermoascus crustaceus]|uniref:uncharacterized protein n=1 Tax=Thermoascus crustaceus TaxID=5088 RepID=UPI003742BCCC
MSTINANSSRFAKTASKGADWMPYVSSTASQIGQRVAARAQLKNAALKDGVGAFDHSEHDNIFTEDRYWLKTPSKFDAPELVLSCAVLLNALMAFSARHLSRTTDFDSVAADRYHQECFSLMIPMLDEKDLVADETLFAAAVILRVFEETNESQMGAGPERRLTGTSVFANAQPEFRTWGGLGHAAFWVFVRQDIYMSLLSQRPLKVDLAGWDERLSFDLGFDATNDCTWANCMTWIVAEIVGFCFGGDTLNNANWEAARAKTERWNLCRAKSFDPILVINRDKDAKQYFPEIRLGHPWHGVQYYYIAKLFLAIYNPNTPRIGLGYQRHRRTISDEVLRNAEALSHAGHGSMIGLVKSKSNFSSC